MEEILDEIKTKNQKETFTKISLICAFISYACFIIFLKRTYGVVKATEVFDQFSTTITRIMQVFAFIGTVSTGLIFVDNEPTTWKKGLAILLNLVMLLFILGPICFYLYIQYTN